MASQVPLVEHQVQIARLAGERQLSAGDRFVQSILPHVAPEQAKVVWPFVVSTSTLADSGAWTMKYTTQTTSIPVIRLSKLARPPAPTDVDAFTTMVPIVVADA